jgi:8-oxo-dGTP pyrophosphatase MutT (NUDIX family)
MIQKKDTISYTEFIRGKYEINNLQYMKWLFDSMTIEEKKNLLSLSFSDLWKNLWNHTSENNKFQKEFNKSQSKFAKLRNGFYMALKDKTIQFINIEVLIANSKNEKEQEWEFPKGRRKLYESDLKCSIREFEEEVGIGEKIVVHDTGKQFEETFSGSNNIRYRNIYYIAQYFGDASLVKFDKSNAQQAKEVRDVKWFTYDEVLQIIKNNNYEKRELFKRINTIIHKHYL